MFLNIEDHYFYKTDNMSSKQITREKNTFTFIQHTLYHLFTNLLRKSLYFKTESHQSKLIFYNLFILTILHLIIDCTRKS